MIIYQISQLTNLLYNLNKSDASVSRIALPVKEGFDFVSISEIVSCQSKNHCTIVNTQSGKKYICDRNIKEYEDLLPTSIFFRIHNSYIVNVNFIRKFFKEGRGGYVELSDGSTVPVAYRRKDEFLAKFGYNWFLWQQIHYFKKISATTRSWIQGYSKIILQTISNSH